MSITILVYEDRVGRRPFEQWFDGLPAPHAAKVTAALTRLAAGNRSGIEPVGSGVAERKIDWGSGIRIYLAFDGPTRIVLLGGGTKMRQSADIKAAQDRWDDYRQRSGTKE